MLSILYLPGLRGSGSDAHLLCYQLTKSTTYNAINFVSSLVDWVIYYAIILLSLQLPMLSILYPPGLNGSFTMLSDYKVYNFLCYQFCILLGWMGHLLCYQLTKSTTYYAINFVSSWVEWVIYYAFSVQSLKLPMLSILYPPGLNGSFTMLSAY